MNGKLKDIVKVELQGLASGSSPNSPTEDGRPSSMIVKKANTMFPAHLIAEAISSLRGLDLRWSGPITPSEMLYVQQYIFTKYPEYCNGLAEDVEKLDIDNLSTNEESSGTPPHDNKLKSPKSVTPKELSPFSSTHSDLDRTQMEPLKTSRHPRSRVTLHPFLRSKQGIEAMWVARGRLFSHFHVKLQRCDGDDW
ncbi:uncharacterized protein LOC125471400 [Pyrus x bretschneideri]|uniref:uncharacterized protein LOC125471400 n=1 Tax=Pyrus x bretschneideri TaxID=225117 RepID=UPI00202E4EE8|nr:uncharacterized protein LOC125471400 [Pyrus x bretschneideri]